VAQGGHISTEPRINERIRVPEVRLVGPAGEQVGIVSINDALRLAQEADLDLVEVAPTARPPVCKLMDYGKFKYESALKARESRKNQAQTVIKEIKLRPKIDPHDYGTKKGHVERFLRQGDKVKVTIMFRGREQSRPELGYRLLQQLAGDVEELGFVEAQPKQDGRNMIMVIGPHRRKTESKAERAAERATARTSRGSAHAAAGSSRRAGGPATGAAATDAAATGAAATDAAATDAAGPDSAAADSGAGGSSAGGSRPGGSAAGGSGPGGDGSATGGSSPAGGSSAGGSSAGGSSAGGSSAGGSSAGGSSAGGSRPGSPGSAGNPGPAARPVPGPGARPVPAPRPARPGPAPARAGARAATRPASESADRRKGES
jgi:translation initiation factor IF-3